MFVSFKAITNLTSVQKTKNTDKRSRIPHSLSAAVNKADVIPVFASQSHIIHTSPLKPRCVQKSASPPALSINHAARASMQGGETGFLIFFKSTYSTVKSVPYLNNMQSAIVIKTLLLLFCLQRDNNCVEESGIGHCFSSITEP